MNNDERGNNGLLRGDVMYVYVSCMCVCMYVRKYLSFYIRF